MVDLAEVKSFVSPPPVVLQAMTAIIMLTNLNLSGTDLKKVSWGHVKMSMSNSGNFLNGLIMNNLPQRMSVSPAAVQEAKGVLKDLTQQRVSQVSRGCGIFFNYC